MKVVRERTECEYKKVKKPKRIRLGSEPIEHVAVPMVQTVKNEKLPTLPANLLLVNSMIIGNNDSNNNLRVTSDDDDELDGRLTIDESQKQPDSEVEEEIKEEIKKEVKDEVKDEVNEKIKEEIKEEVKEEVMEEEEDEDNYEDDDEDYVLDLSSSVKRSSAVSVIKTNSNTEQVRY